MGKGPFRVPVPAQALDEAKPRRNALDNGSHPVGVFVANFCFCEDIKAKELVKKKKKKT